VSIARFHVLIKGYHIRHVRYAVYRRDRLPRNARPSRVSNDLIIEMHLKLVSSITVFFELKCETEAWAVCRISVVFMSEVIIQHFDLLKLLNRVFVEDFGVVLILFLKNQFELIDECNFSAVPVDYESDAGRITGATLLRRYPLYWVTVFNGWLKVVAMLWKKV